MLLYKVVFTASKQMRNNGYVTNTQEIYCKNK